MFDWSQLNGSKSYIIKELITKWNKLLDKNENERKYHEFLSENAGFFLADDISYTVISKLKFGSELESDFVIIRDGFSNGTIYEFIEIEKPHSKLFNSNGVPSKDFNFSLQQIRDWRRWLIDNKSYFRRFLPTVNTRVIHNANLKFKIIIGRRNNSINDLEKRLQISSENNIEIRSFDSLSDNLKNRFFFPYSLMDDEEKLCKDALNLIACPFNKALSDSTWKKICMEERIPQFHIFSRISDLLVSNTKQSSLFNDFI